MRAPKTPPGLKSNVSLKEYTTFRIGGRAEYFFLAKNKKELVDAIRFAKKLKLRFFILSGGSNILVSDKGFPGLVIKVKESRNYNIKNNIVFAEAGVPLSLLVQKTLNKNLIGLEWAIGVPGTVGGAIFGNAKSFGNSISEVIKWVEVFDTKKQTIRRFLKRECKFGYKESVFKKKKHLIILSCELILKKGNRALIEKKIKDYTNYRKATQPLNHPSAGSIFKNPNKFSAGYLIEQCGLKGKRVGRAKISEKHANFIVNLGGAKEREVKKLINLAKTKVKKKFGINLKEEIQFLGF